jgi:hypothetical protein
MPRAKWLEPASPAEFVHQFNAANERGGLFGRTSNGRSETVSRSCSANDSESKVEDRF